MNKFQFIFAQSFGTTVEQSYYLLPYWYLYLRRGHNILIHNTDDKTIQLYFKLPIVNKTSQIENHLVKTTLKQYCEIHMFITEQVIITERDFSVMT